jgi:hypothetical protein
MEGKSFQLLDLLDNRSIHTRLLQGWMGEENQNPFHSCHIP